MVMFFSGIRASVRLPEQIGATYDLQPNLEVENVGYYSAQSFPTSGPYGQVWEGFGAYLVSP